jgi:Uma2 family endonuclease
MIVSLQNLDPNQKYSYADYLTWQFEERIELLKGYFRQMAAPNTKHQRASKRLMNIFENHFQNKKCEAFYAPFDVRLYNRQKSILADQEVFTVVQPDICVVCDDAKIDERGCNGAPELIIEILSQSNKQTDLKDKYHLYAESGVTEYWIIYPQDEVVHQYVLHDEKYELHNVYTKPDDIVPFLFPDLAIPVDKIFPPMD